MPTECKTLEWIIVDSNWGRLFYIYSVFFIHYSIAVHACFADNNFFVKMARSALRLSTHWLVTDLTIQAVKPKNRTTQSQKNLHSVWRPFFPLFLNFTICKKSSFLPLAGLDTSNSSSYFRFKCPTPPGQGSNFPPTERPFRSNSPPSWVRTSVKCPWVVREGGVVETSDWSVH